MLFILRPHRASFAKGGGGVDGGRRGGGGRQLLSAVAKIQLGSVMHTSTTNHTSLLK